MATNTPDNKTLREILKCVFEEGRHYQQHAMQGENLKYIFSGAEAEQAIRDLLLSKLPEKIDWDWADTPNYNQAIDEITKIIKEEI